MPQDNMGFGCTSILQNMVLVSNLMVTVRSEQSKGGAIKLGLIVLTSWHQLWFCTV